MFKLADSNGNEILVPADRWVAGITGVTFVDIRGKIVEFFDWDEIGDVNIVRVSGQA